MTRIGLWIGFLLALGFPVLAEPVRVTSGEHEGFTRLVFDYGKPVDWQVGRSPDGYDLRLKGTSAVYDLTDAFNLIGTSRLAAIWAAPDSGDLQIGLACACHAIPFEFRPGIIVIDLRDGPPPQGSSFEIALDGSPAAPLAGRRPARPRARPAVSANGPAPDVIGSYDWTQTALAALHGLAPGPSKGKPSDATALRPPDPDLQPLRDQILHQIARGAAQGTVEMANPAGRKVDLPETGFPQAQIRLGEATVSVNRPDRSVQGDVGAQGTACAPAEALNLSDWGEENRPLADQMASMRSNLSGEFDRPEPEAVARAIRFQIFLGFGAEARQMIAVFHPQDADAARWRALAYLVEGLPDPEGTFLGQTACSGPAALWSFLADDHLVRGDKIDTGAVRLAFSALPLHLRRLLGPRLAEKFLTLGDETSARALAEAVTRAPGAPGDAVSLMEAELALHTSNPAQAEQIAKAVIAAPGASAPEALIALTEARIAQNLPMTPDIALSLQAHLSDHTGTPLEPRLRAALILAEAASGNFAAAFDGLDDHPAQQAAVWALLARLAPDEVFLERAVLDAATSPPHLPDDTAASIARRLAALGLGTPATQWISAIKTPDPLLVAEAALARSDGRTALAQLAGREDEPANALKMRALALLGENEMRAELLARSGDLPAASAALARADDWDRLATTGEEPWKSLALHLPSTPAPQPDADLPYGPLASGHDLATAGSQTRAAIDALLAAVPAPAHPPTR